MQMKKRPFAIGVTQRAPLRLEIYESRISRDERNEHFGIAVEMAIKIFDDLQAPLPMAWINKANQEFLTRPL